MAAIYIYNVNRQRIQRVERQFKDRKTLSEMRDIDILSNYRFDRRTIEEIVRLVEPALEKGTMRTKAIGVETQVLASLRYLAKGDFYSEVADIHGISRSSFCRILHEFVRAVNTGLNNIKFPSDEHLTEVKRGFYRKCKIPNVVGAIDGSQIPVIAPRQDEAVYVCRKGYHSLNIQAVVDTDMRFMNAVTKWPGSMHDSAIFENCALKEYLQNNDVGHLLGDSGYALRKYLLTPVLRPSDQAESDYNDAHAKGRSVVERAFGLLKSRFRCLHKSGGCLMFEPSKCAQVISACIRLHNLCITNNIPLLVPTVNDADDVQAVIQIPAPQSAIIKRQAIVHLFR